MRIIAHHNNDHWSAQFANFPSLSEIGTFGGPDAFAAMRRLLENSPARHLTLDDFEPHLAECRLNRVVMVLVDRWEGSEHESCPECGGTGKYTGLNTVEPCRVCQEGFDPN
ncbi:MAG: hypothetical protein KDA84_03160 [Planctomycetaceae bacterium]|nr:hypothetical protein [Planctomycetaceae bacterium]